MALPIFIELLFIVKNLRESGSFDNSLQSLKKSIVIFGTGKLLILINGIYSFLFLLLLLYVYIVSTS